MQWSLTIGRIAGTAIRIHITFLLFLVWIAASDYASGGLDAAKLSIVFVLLVFACVVAHEFGHILTARSFGIKTPEVTLLPIGGVANMERIPEEPWQELLVAIAGPMVNVVIAGLLIVTGGFAVADLQSIVLENTTLVQSLALINISLVVFNLIPAFPMDGGRVLRALLAMRLGAQRATEIAAKFGQFFAFLFVATGLFLNPMLVLIGMFIYLAAMSELQANSLRWFARDLTVAEGMERSVRSLFESALLSEAVEALLASSQRVFPVINGVGKPVGLLDRDDLVLGLKEKGPDAAVSLVMRKPTVIGRALPLNDAVSGMNRQGLRSQVVVDGGGHLVGMLTLENVAEMMMIHAIRPEWKFLSHEK
ncbi:MAG: site-2 protease family protein [Aestuariivirga sp.]|nr:site-2 protease family protein [Aestuariivirga sp.]